METELDKKIDQRIRGQVGHKEGWIDSEEHTTFLGVPIAHDEQVLGVLRFTQKADNKEFSEYEKTLLSALGRDIGGKLHELLGLEFSRRLVRFNDLREDLFSEVEKKPLGEWLEKILGGLFPQPEGKHFWICRLTSHGSTYYSKRVWPKGNHSEVECEIEGTFFERVLSKEEGVCRTDLFPNEDFPNGTSFCGDTAARCIVAVAIRRLGLCVGVIGVTSHAYDIEQTHDRIILREVARQVAREIARRELSPALAFRMVRHDADAAFTHWLLPAATESTDSLLRGTVIEASSFVLSAMRAYRSALHALTDSITPDNHKLALKHIAEHAMRYARHLTPPESNNNRKDLHIELRYGTAQIDRVVRLDNSILNAILVNLLTNARKFGEKQITLTISVEDHPDGDWLRIEVCDQGLGLPPEVIEELRDYTLQDPLFSHWLNVNETTRVGLRYTTYLVGRWKVGDRFGRWDYRPKSTVEDHAFIIDLPVIPL